MVGVALCLCRAVWRDDCQNWDTVYRTVRGRKSRAYEVPITFSSGFIVIVSVGLMGHLDVFRSRDICSNMRQKVRTKSTSHFFQLLVSFHIQGFIFLARTLSWQSLLQAVCCSGTTCHHEQTVFFSTRRSIGQVRVE